MMLSENLSLFKISTHPLLMREYLLRYAGTDRIKKSHYAIADADHWMSKVSPYIIW